MKIFFDTEFIDTGKTIDLISIGLVREDGKELYLENIDTDWTKADQWVIDNVKSKLGPAGNRVGRATIRDRVREFAGQSPEFWAYFADYDWIVLSQLYGRMLDVPQGWPHYCRDLKQEMDIRTPGVKYPKMAENLEHNALADARWVRDTYALVQKEHERWAKEMYNKIARQFP